MDFYYKAFDSDRNSLAGLYGNDSMLTFEGAPLQGTANIIQKLSVRTAHLCPQGVYSTTSGAYHVL